MDRPGRETFQIFEIFPLLASGAAVPLLLNEIEAMFPRSALLLREEENSVASLLTFGCKVIDASIGGISVGSVTEMYATNVSFTLVSPT